MPFWWSWPNFQCAVIKLSRGIVIHNVIYNYIITKQFGNTSNKAVWSKYKHQMCALVSTTHGNHKGRANSARWSTDTRLTQKTTNIAASRETESLQSKLKCAQMPHSENRLEILSSNGGKSKSLETKFREAEHRDHDRPFTRAAWQFREDSTVRDERCTPQKK